MQHCSFCFILIERDCFIAHDMDEGLLEACGFCTSRRIACIHELFGIEDELTELAALPVIITKASLHEIQAAGLDDLARRRNWPMVVRMGLDPVSEIEARGWLSLAAPFSREDLARLIDELRLRYPHLVRKSA